MLEGKVKVPGLVCLQDPSIGNKWKSLRKEKAFQNYIETVCRLSWKMTIQRPPMLLDFAEVRKDDQAQDLHWNSQVVDNAKVGMVFPELTHGNQVMAKGKVFLYVSS